MSAQQLQFQNAVDLQQRGLLADAEQAYRQVLAQQPGHFPAQLNLGIALHGLERFEEAELEFGLAVALRPAYATAHFSRANALVELSRFEDALKSFDRAIELQPDFAAAYRNRGILRLLCGDYENGLSDYEHRRPANPYPGLPPVAQVPFWEGQSLDGRSILVSDSTGFGDEIQMCRYLPLLAKRAAKVTFLGKPSLYRLLDRLTPGVQLLPSLAPGQRFDFQCKLLSLPFLLGTRIDSIPAQTPYLSVESALAEKWKQRLGSHGFRIGVCWRGNPNRSIDAGRSLPLAGLASLARLPTVRLISLQKGVGQTEIADLPEQMQVETLGDDFDSGPDAFVDTAAVIANLDLVISSCTSVAHLAGALRAPVWVALKKVPEWRWSLLRQDTPWYPGMRLFRQQQRGQWTAVMAAMTGALSRELAAR